MYKHSPLKYRILMIALIIFIPVFAVFQYYVVQFVRQMDEQIAGGLSSSLSVYLRSVRQEFNNIDAFMFKKVWDSESFIGLQSPTDSLQKAEHLAQLQEMGEELLQNTPSLSGVFFYSTEQQVDQAIFNSRNSFVKKDKQKLIDTLHDVSDAGIFNNLGWTTININDKPLLVRIASWGNMYCICVVDMTAMGRNAQRDYLMSTSVIFLQKEQLLTSAQWIQPYANAQVRQGEGYHILQVSQGSHMVVHSNFLNFTAIYGAPYSDGQWVKVSSIAYIFVVLMTFLIAWMAVRFSILMPLGKLEQVMKHIRDGNLEERSDDFRSAEFAHVNETFNQMIGTINQLKIDSYERQLDSKRLEMDALRLQIRPHFYLNCLKNLYGLSQMNNQLALQQSILYLSDHLRYTFDLQKDRISLREELEMCGNYLQLQGVGQQNPPTLTLSVESNVMEFILPPVSVLTLVENCFKHGVKMQQQLKISITARQFTIDNSRVVSLCVADNGSGFSQEMLNRLNHCMEGQLEGTCVGLRNVVRRFQLLYGELFSIAFFNRNGAVIELIIQLKEGACDEAVDC